MSRPVAKHRPALCRTCGKSDCILVVDALAATSTVHVGGERMPYAPKDVGVPERWVLICCTRCNRLLAAPHVERVTG